MLCRRSTPSQCCVGGPHPHKLCSAHIPGHCTQSPADFHTPIHPLPTPTHHHPHPHLLTITLTYSPSPSPSPTHHHPHPHLLTITLTYTYSPSLKGVKLMKAKILAQHLFLLKHPLAHNIRERSLGYVTVGKQDDLMCSLVGIQEK